MSESAPAFDDAFRRDLARLLEWRRDVRRFRADPVPAALLDELLDLAQDSPSVGNSQPWRFVKVDSAARRRSVRDNFLRCNADALAALEGERAQLYARLKLSGLDVAPIQLAVFCDHGTTQGHGLGIRTMPEMLDYSVAAMIACLWLAARAAGLGIGWVSILDPHDVAKAVDAPADHKLIAYLCVGWPEEEHVEPELMRRGWQARTQAGRRVSSV